MLVDGRLIVMGTELRGRAYENIRSEFPNSLMFLELSRLAAFAGYDVALGNCGHPVNWDDIRPRVENSSFGSVPDLRPYTFKRSFR
jgi:hypothetical protein